MFPYWIDRYGRKKRETNVQQTNKEKTMKKKKNEKWEYKYLS